MFFLFLKNNSYLLIHFLEMISSHLFSKHKTVFKLHYKKFVAPIYGIAFLHESTNTDLIISIII